MGVEHPCDLPLLSVPLEECNNRLECRPEEDIHLEGEAMVLHLEVVVDLVDRRLAVGDGEGRRREEARRPEVVVMARRPEVVMVRRPAVVMARRPAAMARLLVWACLLRRRRAEARTLRSSS